MLNRIVYLFANIKKNMPYLIEKMAEAIKEHEGYFVPGQYEEYPEGSLSFRNNNPGNLRFAAQYGAHSGNNGFAVFDTYQDGWRALIHQIEIAASGRSKVYAPEMTLYQFFSVYAPASDRNNSRLYAEKVAHHMEVSPLFVIKDLLDNAQV